MTALTMDRQMKFENYLGLSTPSSYVLTWDRALDQQYVIRSASISASVNTALSFLLSKSVTIEDNTKVEDFLAHYYGIVAYLYEAPNKISQEFGQPTLKLGLFSDPDSGDEYSELYLEVETNLSPEEATTKLSKINREWLLASNDQDLVSLNITLKFA
jgi:hypothetical protein